MGPKGGLFSSQTTGFALMVQKKESGPEPGQVTPPAPTLSKREILIPPLVVRGGQEGLCEEGSYRKDPDCMKAGQ